MPPQNNHAYYNNPEVDRLLNESESELDEEARLEMLREVQRIISEDQPAIFLEHFKWFLPMSTTTDRVHALTALVLGRDWPRSRAGGRITTGRQYQQLAGLAVRRETRPLAR